MISIAPMLLHHWPEVQSIYKAGISSGHATFRTTVPEWEEWDEGHLPHSRLLALEGAVVLGWAALSPVSSRPWYGGVAEVSVYVHPQAQGRGVGKALLRALVIESERHGIWTLYASIFPENRASVVLHRGCGFREIGYRERIGQLNGVWRNTVIMERRSQAVGV